jgi:hypothetical protein
MPARTFEDSAGVVWEVFEVHRSSQKSGAVSAGLEKGWLAFVSGDAKRRLAPFPSEWLTADVKELERLCSIARVARATGITKRVRSTEGRSAAAPPAPRPPVPRIRPSQHSRAPFPDGERLVTASASPTSPPERTVREFAHEARARGLPAIGAMIELKGLLSRLYPESDSPARDVRSVRRWFVESYYFERGGESPDGDSAGGDGQSR